MSNDKINGLFSELDLLLGSQVQDSRHHLHTVIDNSSLDTIIEEARKAKGIVNVYESMTILWEQWRDISNRGQEDLYACEVKSTGEVIPPKICTLKGLVREHSVIPIPSGKRLRKRQLRAGPFLPHILSTLYEMGGSGSVSEVLERVYPKVEHIFTDEDKTAPYKWRTIIYNVRSSHSKSPKPLVDRIVGLKYLHNRRHSAWGLTEEGVKYVEDNLL